MKKILHWKILLLGIVLLAAFLRFYHLSSIPAGLTNDEVDIGYDAYSIYHTGRDQWGEFMPLISFKGFGDYRPPLYTYLVTPIIPIFGLTATAVRFPAALFSTISVVLLFFIIKKIFSEKAGLFGSLLFAISPWAIGLGRMGIESNVGLTFLLAGILSFLHYKQKIAIYLSMTFFALTLYTYSGYTLLTPLVIMTLIIFFFKQLLKQRNKTILSIILFVLLCSPLFLKHDASATVRFSQINFLKNINSIGILDTLNSQRGECIKTYPSKICKIAINKGTAFGTTIITNYLSHFSVSFLFTDGTETQYSILPKRGLLYIFEFFLIIAGFVLIIKKREKEGYLLLALLLVAPIPDTITGSGHYSRSFIMLPFLISIEALGFIQLLSLLDKSKIPTTKTAFSLFTSFVITTSLGLFFLNYTSYFRTFNSRFSSYGYEELMNYVQSEKNNYDRIYISRHLNDTKHYVYYLFYTKFDPALYQSKENITVSQNTDGWVNVERINNIYFVDSLPAIKPNSDLAKENLLFISAPDDFSKKIKGIKTIRDLKNDVLFKAVPHHPTSY